MVKKNSGERLDTGALGPVMLEHLHRYAIVLDIIRGKKVLDIACGEGYGTALMASTASEVVGADVDADTIAAAKNKYTNPNIEFVEASILSLPFKSETFDVLVCYETLEHVSDHSKVLAELKRVLKSSGFLIISTPNKEEYSVNRSHYNPFHVRELNVDEFKQLIGQYFNYSRFWFQESLLSSMIYAEENSSIDMCFTGNYKAITKTPVIKPIYCIALASQLALTTGLPSGIFRNDLLTEQYFLDERNSARKTATYRLGHLLLWPVKKLYFALRRKNYKR